MSGGQARRPVRQFPPLPAITDLVGRTPLVKIGSLASVPGVRILAKLEYFNPGGSVKDRAALQMVLEALANRRLTAERTLIDSTSGNTGVAYSWIGAALGFRVALVMPANVSIARKRITGAYGAQLIYSDPMEGSDGAIRLVRQLVEKSPNSYFYPDQYSNEANPLAHYLSTGEEIWQQTGGEVTHLVCGIGTGGTVMGTGRRLREHRRDIRVIGVEPAEALHGLEGLKHMPSSIVPAIYREEELDEKISVSTDEGWEMADRLLAEEGLLVGRSAGAAMVGALRVARQIASEGKRGTIVTVFADRGDRYFEPRPLGDR